MWYTLFFSAVWTLLKPVIMTLIKLLSKELLEFVAETVTQLSTTDLSNADKRLEAFNLIKAKAKADGKELRSSIINLLIEWAVVNSKKIQ